MGLKTRPGQAEAFGTARISKTVATCRMATHFFSGFMAIILLGSVENSVKGKKILVGRDDGQNKAISGYFD